MGSTSNNRPTALERLTAEATWGLNPFKFGVLFIGHRQTVHYQIRRLRLCTVCLQNVLLVLKIKAVENTTKSLKMEMDWSS